MMDEETLKAVRAALQFYADETRYNGPNEVARDGDPWLRQGTPYRLDAGTDRGDIARKAIACLDSYRPAVRSVAERVRLNLCNRCGKRPRFARSRYCERCKDWSANYLTKRKKRLIDAGICFKCAREPAAPASHYCDGCRDYFAERDRRMLKANRQRRPIKRTLLRRSR